MDNIPQIKLVIVDDSWEMCEILTDFFEMIPEINLCGIAKNGKEALEKIQDLQPDVVLLDVIMPQMDGISVLEKLKSDPPAKMPHIIVTSAVGLEKVTNKALDLGASYYMIKPYNLGDLLNRILMFSAPEQKSKVKENFSNSLYHLTAQLLMDLKFPTHRLGYQYILEAVDILNQLQTSGSMGKSVYELIAENHNTTAQCVESAIRQAISKAYQENPDSFTWHLPQLAAGKKPSNGKFLTLLSEKIKLGIGGI